MSLRALLALCVAAAVAGCAAAPEVEIAAPAGVFPGPASMEGILPGRVVGQIKNPAAGAAGDVALYDTTPTAVVDGQRYPLSIDANRNLNVVIASGGGVVDTELAAAAALADNAANPTTATAGAALLAYDGATWDRVTNGNGVAAAALRVSLASDSTGQVALAAGTANIGSVGAIVNALPAGTNNIGDVDVLTFPDNEPFNVAQIGGAATTAGAGAVAAGTQRTTLASDDPAVTALQIVDDWDEANRAAVNPIAGQIGIAGGTGVDGATVPRVTLATNVGLPAGANNIGDVDVLTVPALIAGTATIGSVGAIVNALPAGGNNIGDVDVLTINGQAPAFGAGAAGATVLRTTLATDDVVSVDWNGTAPPIGAGAEVAALRVAIATDSTIALEAGAANIGDVDVLTVNGVAPAFGAGVVGATVQRVTVSTDDVVSVDDNAASLTTDSLTDIAPDAAFPGTARAIAGRASTAKPAAMSGDADAVGIWTSRVGSIRTLSGEVALVTSSTLGADLAIVAANTGNRLVLVTVRERDGATATLTVRHGTVDTDTMIVPVSLAANGVAVYQFPGGVNCDAGVFIDWLSGSVEVTVGTEDHE